MHIGELVSFKKQYNLGIALKLVNLGLFTILSLLFHFITQPLHKIQVFFLVSLFAAAFFLPWIILNKIKFLGLHNIKQYCLRAIFNVIGMITWIEALNNLNLNQATAISYIIPIFTTILAIIFCNEEFNLKCFTAITASIIGMYIIIAPSNVGLFSYGTTIAILSSLIWACHDIVCKKQASTEHYLTQGFYLFVLTSIFLAPFAWIIWQPLNINNLYYIILLGIVSATNVIVLFLAYKFAPIGLLMPFSYCRLIFMAFATYILFNHTLAWNTVLGSIIICSASAYIFYQQQKGKLLISK